MSKQQHSTCLPDHLIKLGLYSMLYNLRIWILQWSAIIVSIECVGRTRNYVFVGKTCIIGSISKMWVCHIMMLWYHSANTVDIVIIIIDMLHTIRIMMIKCRR